MAHPVFTLETFKKLAVLFRDHRIGQIVNVLRFGYHSVRGFSATRLPYEPVWLNFFITARCNLRCAHCQYGSPNTPHEPQQFRDMTLETFEQILDRYPRATSIVLAGGEPLLHPQLFEMIRMANKRRMKVHISSNGVLLSGKVDAFLEAPVELLNVSLYGTDPESFRKLTGVPGSVFHNVVRAMAELARRRQPHGRPRIFRASFICTTQTMYSAIDFVRLCESIGVDQVKLRNLCYFGVPGYEEWMCLNEGDSEAQVFIDSLRRERFRIPVFLPRLYRSDYTSRPCSMPFRYLSIDGDGFIGPCCVRGTGNECDNVRDQPDIWNGPTMIQARSDMKCITRPLPSTCMHCEEMVAERCSVGG